MSVSASVNYHVHSPNRQYFYIDAHGIEGNLISPTLTKTNITVEDLRDSSKTLNFSSNSVEFINSPSSIKDFTSSEDWQTRYNQELTALLTRQLDIKDVVIFDHTIRIDTKTADRKPARNVHGDYSESSAQKRLEDILGKSQATQWARGHYGFINIWRPIESPIKSSPLGFINPESVSKRDWITLGLIYPDREGEIMGLVYNEHHHWFYLSHMAPNEVVMFNIYDNKGLPTVAHSALDLSQSGEAGIRKSIESRTLVRYA